MTLLGIDWGTSNRRAYLIERGGKLVRQQADGQGLLAVGGQFAASLAQLRAGMGVESSVPVIMSGMVGSASGWQEVPYLDLAVPLERLPEHLVAVQDSANCLIVPGYRSAGPDVDVMRGEETQLLGAVSLGVRDGWVVLPGTHSKWVFLRNGRVERLCTYMTGELFAMLGSGGTLAAIMENGHESPAAFSAGLAEAGRGKPLSHSLFGVRARVVTKAMPSADARSFVSGLLIGSEFVAAQGQDTVHLIASHTLSARYAQAAGIFGMQAKVLDPDQVYLAALEQFFSKV